MDAHDDISQRLARELLNAIPTKDRSKVDTVNKTPDTPATSAADGRRAAEMPVSKQRPADH